MIRIVIADDHRLFRETLGAMLESSGALEIVALCRDSDETIEVLQSEQMDLILLDMKMKPLPGIATTQKIRHFSAIKTIGLSMYSLPSYATNMFSAGANGYITKNSPLDEVFTGIDAVMKGKKYLCREVRNLMVTEELKLDEKARHIGLLTAREIEVAQHISKGLSSKEIALALDCTCKTIEVHRHHMLKKLQLKNTSALINLLSSHSPVLL